jgi:hypothetical protein
VKLAQRARGAPLTAETRAIAPNPLERAAAAVCVTFGRAPRVRRRGRSTASRYPAF